jgi:hypothetical protein
MKYLSNFNKFNLSENVRIDASLDATNPYTIQRVGQPLNKRESDILKERIWGKGFMPKLFNYGYLDNKNIRKEDNEYYITFLNSILVIDKFNELVEIVYFDWCLKTQRYKKLRKYVESSKILNNLDVKKLVLKNLDSNLKINWDDYGYYDIDSNVEDLIKYIKAYF